MRIRLDPFSAVTWLYYLWVWAAYWIADGLGILTHRFLWLYIFGHGLAVHIVGNWLERKLGVNDPKARSLLNVKLSRGPIAVLAAIAMASVIEYFVLLRYFRHLLTEAPLGIPFHLLCVPLIIAATLLEASWTKQPQP